MLTLIGLVKYNDVIYRLFWQEWEPALATTLSARVQNLMKVDKNFLKRWRIMARIGSVWNENEL